MDGTNGSTTFTDSEPNPTKTITVNGNAQISTSVSKFGGASGAFDGSGDYLNSASTSTDFAPGSSDFTFHTWVYFNDVNFNGQARQFLFVG